jgi:hypothetical protein
MPDSIITTPSTPMGRNGKKNASQEVTKKDSYSLQVIGCFEGS